MKQTLTTIFFGKEANFFINAKSPKIIKVQKLDRERSAVELTFEVDCWCTSVITVENGHIRIVQFLRVNVSVGMEKSNDTWLDFSFTCN